MSELQEQLERTLGGGYHVGRELGGGGMARVFVADDRELGRKIVVKVLAPELAAGVSAERFRREIHVAVHLNHPHIVPVIGAGQTSDLLYYTMPLIQGESLRALLEREGQLSLDRTLAIARDVADALDYAHGENIVHRDIKPDNILVESSSGRALVTDFGIARAIERAVDLDSVTSTGLTLGTPTYMSPEQATAERRIDGRSDIYSMACVIYEMLAGMPPFTAPNVRALIAQHLNERPRSLATVRPDLPAHIDDALQKALAKAPADRFPTAAAFVAALDGNSMALSRASQARSTPRLRGIWQMTFGILALAVGGLFVTSAWFHDHVFPGTASRPSLLRSHIAVLYLDAPDSSARLVGIAHGVTRDLIFALQSVPDLTLVSELGIRKFGSRASPDSVARQLGVGTVIHGSVSQMGDSLQVEVHLTDAETLDERQAVRVTSDGKSTIELHDRVVQQVGGMLRQEVGHEVRLRQWQAGTRSSSAWELRQRAQELIDEVAEMPSRPVDFAPQLAVLARAESLLIRASREDTRWTEPLIARGWLLGMQCDLTPLAAVKRQLLDLGVALADTVLAREPQNAAARELRGQLRFQRYSQLPSSPSLRDSAEQDLRIATNDEPRLARAWNVLSIILDEKGDDAGSLYAARRAIVADAYRPEAARSTTRLVFAHLFAGHGDSARALCDTARRRFANNPTARTCEISVLGWVGRGAADVARAWRALDEVERAGPYPLANGMFVPGRFYVAAVIARTGWADSAEAVLRSTRDGLRDTPHRRDWRINEAFPRLLLGERAMALDLLEEAVHDEPSLRAQIARLPWFTPLRGDPRFERLISAPTGSTAPYDPMRRRSAVAYAAP